MKAFAWLAAGGVLLFAVSGHPAFIDVRVVGLILIVRGIAGLWTDLGRERRAHCKRQLAAAVARGADAFESFTADLDKDDAVRVPLADLLGRRVGRGRG
ncbi:MAG TPA: hypothetical protein VEV63_00710 [Streptosporangiaceae bacterium]|nr:hypothetical protein [Streptosporangiaceae bacterium]